MASIKMHNHSKSLYKIIQNYKLEAKKPAGFASEHLHFHEKNPAAALQIKLLEILKNYIDTNLGHDDGKKAELGALLILRALFSDPNPEGKVFYYLIEKLDLAHEIQNVLAEVSPGETMDPTHPMYSKISRAAIKYCKTIITSLIKEPEINNEFSEPFIKDLLGTIDTELEYDDRVFQSMTSSIGKTN